MRTLNEVIDRMNELSEKGLDVYFEGRGDGTVGVVVEGLFIIPNKEIKK